MADDLVFRREACPVCHARNGRLRPLFAVPFVSVTASVLRCGDCGVIFKDHALTPAGLNAIYGQQYVHFDQVSNPNDAAFVTSTIQKLHRASILASNRRPRILDVGCGGGGFVRVAVTRGWDAFGIDEFLPAELSAERFTRGSIVDVPDGAFDVVFLLNVMEHLVDPHAMMREVRRVLRPGGVAFMNCPWGGSLARRLYRSEWKHLVLDEHLTFWTVGSLRRLVRANGFAGRSSYRIGGLPFPLGKRDSRSAADSTSHGGHTTRQRQRQLTVAQRLWRLARTIQKSGPATSALQRVVHWTRTGDYLEFAVRVS